MDGLSLEELVHFYNARDLFLDIGNCAGQQNLAKGFEQLKRSRVPEAVYVTSLFASVPTRPSDVYHALKGPVAEGNVIALCYSGFCHGYTVKHIKQAARMGHALAMGRSGKQRWIDLAAAAGDRHAMHDQATRLWYSNDRHGALNAWLRASELGYGVSMVRYAQHGPLSYYERYEWYGRALHVCGHHDTLMQEAKRHLYTCSDRLALFIIGRAVHGHEHLIHQGYSDTATKVVALYVDCMKRARAATLTWLLVAKQVGLYKDVNQLVARMVWNDRHEFLENEYDG